MDRRIPQVVRAQLQRRGLFALVFLGIAVTVTAAFQPKSGWRTLEIYAFALMGGLIIDLWLHSLRLEEKDKEASNTIEELTEERDAAQAAFSDVDDRLGEVEAENLQLEWERNHHRDRANHPDTTLQSVLHAIDAQGQVLSVVRKHRELAELGLSQWPVTAIRRRDEDQVVVIAHVDDHAERLSGEFVSVVDAAGFILVSGTASAAASNQLIVFVSPDTLPPSLQESIDDTGSAPVVGYVLKLTGLVVAPYSTMTDVQIEQLAEVLHAAAKEIAERLVGDGQITIETPEEVE